MYSIFFFLNSVICSGIFWLLSEFSKLVLLQVWSTYWSLSTEYEEINNRNCKHLETRRVAWQKKNLLNQIIKIRSLYFACSLFNFPVTVIGFYKIYDLQHTGNLKGKKKNPQKQKQQLIICLSYLRLLSHLEFLLWDGFFPEKFQLPQSKDNFCCSFTNVKI